MAKYVVTYKNAEDKLVNMFCRQYPTAQKAKTAIELDAEHFAWVHRYHGGPAGMKFRQKTGWVNPKVLDYYEVRAQDGSRCVWQYFKI